MSCNKLRKNNFSIDVDITNLILTPLSCASLVSKIIKCLIYEKSQIPYPYERLKTLIDKKRKSESEDNDKQKNYQAERHYRMVSNAYDAIELLIKELKNHFRDGNKVEEILLLFGGSELSPKEVYRIRIPYLAFGHLENYHVTVTDKLSHTVLRKVFLCQEWMETDHNLPPTNMFVFLKTNGDNLDNSEFFIPNSSFYFPTKTLIVDITLNFNRQKLVSNCCGDIKIFQDEYEGSRLLNNEDKLIQQSTDNENENSQTEWYQANVRFKGFKEGSINQVPLSQLW